MSLATNVSNLTTAVATKVKTLFTLINGNDATGVSRLTTNSTTLVDAINETYNLAESASGGGVAIDDVTPSTTTTYSSSKIEDELANVSVDMTELIDDNAASGTTVYSSTKTEAQITAAKADVKSDILGGADPAYDTLLELQGAVTDNDSAIAGLVTSIGEKVSYTVDQTGTITTPQQGIARTNIGAASAAQMVTDYGDPSTGFDFVATFEAGLN